MKTAARTSSARRLTTAIAVSALRRRSSRIGMAIRIGVGPRGDGAGAPGWRAHLHILPGRAAVPPPISPAAGPLDPPRLARLPGVPPGPRDRRPGRPADPLL